MNAKSVESIAGVLREYNEIKYAYLFGSQASDSAGPLSDVDIAVYVSPKPAPDFLLDLYAKLSPLLKKNEIDIVNLADPTVSSLLKYNIVTQGVLLFEREPYHLKSIPSILNNYFDEQLFFTHD